MIKLFFSVLPRIEKIENPHIFAVQSELLKTILFTICISISITILLVLFGILPFGSVYTLILGFYVLVNAIAYWLIYTDTKYYTVAVHIIVFSSLLTFAMMSVDVLYDTFRFIWFFLLSFISFILGGTRYGITVSLLIYVIVLGLYSIVDLHLSGYELFSFVSALFIFNIFTIYFLGKIKTDTVTFERRIEEEVNKRQTHEQLLLRQHRMANMGEMIDTIAHQWRQPLANANMILLNMEEELDNREYIASKIIELSTLNTHMSQTIDDFRHLLHDSKNKTTFELYSAIVEVLGLMHNQLTHINVQYTNRMNHQIFGYKNELIQVLIILLSNAIEALEIREIDDKRITLIVEEKKDRFTIHIEDNAGGIKAEVMQTLFEPYVSTKKSIGGTGLGLYIAKLIVEDVMHGHLNVTQGLAGARFTMEIKRT